MSEFHHVETALMRLLACCRRDHPAAAFDLRSWREHFQKAEFVDRDGGSGLVLDSEAEGSAVRATLRDGSLTVEWLLQFDGRLLIGVEGASANALAGAAWRMLRSVAEGATTAKVIDRPAKQSTSLRLLSIRAEKANVRPLSSDAGVPFSRITYGIERGR